MEFIIKLKNIFKNEKFYIGLSVLILGAILNQLVSIYIYNKYPVLPTLRDTILDNLPVIRISWIFDSLAILSVLFFIFYAYKKDYKKIPYFLFLFGVLQIVRGFFIILTPFANPDLSTYNGFVGSSIFRRGLYPSGHTGTVFLAYLLSKGVYKKILLSMSIAIIICLLLAHGHYSIDLFSAIIFAYAVYMIGEKHLKKIFTIN